MENSKQTYKTGGNVLQLSLEENTPKHIRNIGIIFGTIAGAIIGAPIEESFSSIFGVIGGAIAGGFFGEKLGNYLQKTTEKKVTQSHNHVLVF